MGKVLGDNFSKVSANLIEWDKDSTLILNGYGWMDGWIYELIIQIL